MALNPIVHHMKKVGNDLVLDKVTPYAAIKGDMVGGQEVGYYYLQSGHCYSGKNGKPMKLDEIPEWLWNRMKSMNKVVLEETGWLEKMQEHFSQPVKPKEKRGPKKFGRPRKTPEVAPAGE